MSERLRLIYENPTTPEREYIMCPPLRDGGYTDTIAINAMHFQNIMGSAGHGSAVAQSVSVESVGTHWVKVNVHVTVQDQSYSSVKDPPLSERPPLVFM
eukprot:1126947_1